MKQIFYIIQREVSTHIRKRSFILFSIISPLIFILPFIFMLFGQASQRANEVGIIDETGLLRNPLSQSDERLKFTLLNTSIDEAKLSLIQKKGKFLGLVYIPKNFDPANDRITPLRYYVPTEKEINPSNTAVIESFINKNFLKLKLSQIGLSEEAISNLSWDMKIYPIILQNQQMGARRMASTLSYALGMLMYLMLIIYNNSLLRGIIEEKGNRIVEVFSMVVNPFYLMMGKILGIGAIALFQLMIWICLSFVYSKVVNYISTEWFHVVSSSQDGLSLQELFQNLNTLPLVKILVFTPVFFIFGFLMNGAITAAVAATSDAKGESSLTFLSNFLNLASIYVAMYSASYPDTALAQISIFIPILSPIVLPALLPFDLPATRILISLIILCVSFIGTSYIAGKIYRISILSYGNKMSFRDIFKILRTGEA